MTAHEQHALARRRRLRLWIAACVLTAAIWIVASLGILSYRTTRLFGDERLVQFSLVGGRAWLCSFVLTSFDDRPDAIAAARLDFLGGPESPPDDDWWFPQIRSHQWTDRVGLVWPNITHPPRYPHFPATVWVDLTAISFPLWIPFLACCAVTAIALRRATRRVPAGHCTACGYNLTGNTSGRCPECGTPA